MQMFTEGDSIIVTGGTHEGKRGTVTNVTAHKVYYRTYPPPGVALDSFKRNVRIDETIIVNHL